LNSRRHSDCIRASRRAASRDHDPVVAGQFVGFGDKLGDRRDELARLLDRER
jgi:hypothetical protein